MLEWRAGCKCQDEATERNANPFHGISKYIREIEIINPARVRNIGYQTWLQIYDQPKSEPEKAATNCQSYCGMQV